MRVNTYKTQLNNDRHCSLIKEKSFNYPKEKNLNCQEKIVQLMNDVFELNLLDTEYFYILCMDSKCQLTGIFEISHGTANCTLVSPREILIKSLLLNAVNVVAVHNHPSGYTCPSNEDIQLTTRLKKSFDLIDINLVDHIIIGDEKFYSFAENKLI